MTYFIKMEVKYGLDRHKADSKPCVLTIGNFDGVHKGHQELIKQVVKVSTSRKLPSGLMTFSPHPLKVLAPEKNIKLIFSLEDRIELLSHFHLDFVVVQPFNRELSQLDPESFFKNLLIDGLKVKYLIVGHDFNFGKNRSGSLEVLATLCKKYEVEFEIVRPVEINGEVVSSSKIREAVAQGEIEKANLMMGREFSLKGVVERGAGRGHKIGFPTANLFSSGELFPKIGVYTTFMELEGLKINSVTNVGRNPTFNQGATNPIQVETHILDFNRDIYGMPVKIDFLHFMRGEIKFSKVEDLIAKIASDVQWARGYGWPK